MTVLVTGGAGFIGSALVHRLLAEGHEVTVLDDLSTGRLDRLGSPPRLRMVQGDVVDPTAVRDALHGVDLCFHHAAVASVARSVREPGRNLEISTVGTARLLEIGAQTGLRRIVFASSSAVYGDDAPVPTPETAPLDPRSPYAVGKASAEALLRAGLPLYGIESVVLRYFNVYGAGQDPRGEYAAAIPRFAQALVAGLTPTFFGDGHQTRDFCHVDDVVRANLAAAARAPGDGRAYNVGTGQPTTLWQLWAAMEVAARAVGVEAGVAPPRVAPARPGDVRHSTALVDRATRELGITATTPLAEGLQDPVRAARSQPVPPP